MEIVYATTTTDVSALALESGGTLTAIKALLPAALISGRLDVAVGACTATVPVSGSVSVSNLPVTQPVSGTVSISGTVTTAGTSTVTQGAAGASAWPVSLASLPALAAGSAVIGHVVVDTAPTTAVTIASLPALTTGSATIGKADQGAGGASAWKVDGSAVTQPVSIAVAPALVASTAVIGHVIADSGSTTAVTSLPALPAGSNAIGSVIVTSTPTTAVTLAVAPALVASSAVIGHVIADSGSTTAVTSLPSIPAGANAIGSVMVTSAPTTAVTIASLPALTAGSAVIGHVIVDTAPTTAVTIASLPALTTGAATIGKVDQGTGGASAWKVDGSAVTQPVSLASVPSHAVTITGTTQQAVANSVTIVGPSDKSLRVVDCTPTGALWTTSVGLAVTLTAAGTLIVPAVAGQYLRSVNIENPTNAAAIFYFLYHGTSPTWSVTGLTIASGTLISSSQVGAANSANAIADLPGGLLVPNGVTLVIANASGAVANVTYAAPVSACWATVRYGT